MLPDLSNSYDSGQFKKLRSASFTEKPETVLPGGAFGGEDTLEATPERLGDIVVIICLCSVNMFVVLVCILVPSIRKRLLDLNNI